MTYIIKSFILHILLTFFIFIQINSAILNEELTIYYDSLDLNIYIGSYTKEELFDLSLTSDLFWVSTSLYTAEKDSESISHGEEFIIINHQNIKAELLESPVHLIKENITIPSFPLYYTIDYVDSAFDTIPLAHRFNNESFSFVHRLYKLKLIPELKFAFTFLNRYTDLDPEVDDEGIISFGGIPKEVSSKLKYVQTFNVDPDHKYWVMKLENAVLKINENNVIKKYEFENKQHAYLNSVNENILAPYSYFKYLNQTIFNNYYENKSCWYEEEEGISCFCESMPDIKEFILVIEGVAFVLNKTEIVEEIRNECFFKVNVNEDNREMWSIGINLYQKYAVEFDYSKHNVKLYSKTPFQYFKYAKTKYYKAKTTLLLIGNVLSLIGFIMLSYANYKTGKTMYRDIYSE